MKKNDLEKLINNTVSQEVKLLKKSLSKEYKKILEEMNARGILYSGITRKSFSKKGNEIVEDHLKNLVSTLNGFPVRIKEEYWLKMETELKKEIEDLEGEYHNKIVKIAGPYSTMPKPLFQNAKEQLESLIKDNVLKSQAKGFESEAFYRVAANKRSIIALIISIISIVFAVLTWIFK